MTATSSGPRRPPPAVSTEPPPAATSRPRLQRPRTPRTGRPRAARPGDPRPARSRSPCPQRGQRVAPAGQQSAGDVFRRQRVTQVITPGPVDVQVPAPQAFLAEAQLLHHPAAGVIL